MTLRPASGPPGATAAIEAFGFGKSAMVVVESEGKTLTRTRTSRRGSFDASFRIPARGHGQLKIVSSSRTRRVVSLLQVTRETPTGDVGEVASGRGARVRWEQDQRPGAHGFGLRGAGFPARRQVSIKLGKRAVDGGRTDRWGRFSTRLTLPLPTGRHRAMVRVRTTILTFDLTIEPGPVSRGFTVPPAPSGAPSGPSPTLPPSPPPAPSPQPDFPIRAAFYYGWFPEAWNQSGINPFTKYHPSLGFYDTSDSAVRRFHLSALEHAGFDAAIYSWWGQGSKTDLRFSDMLADTDATGSPIKWALYYEPEGYADPSTVDIGSDLDYIKSTYTSDPAYLEVGGKPVIFVYARGTDACQMADRWVAANTESRGFYLVLKVFAGYRTCTSQPQSWHQYAPSSRTDRQRGYSFAISPEFDLTGPEPERLPRDLAAFEQAAQDMVASGEPWQLVISFNEWGENTATESADEWASASGYGQYLDALAAL